MSIGFLPLLTTVALWLVADLDVLSYQVTPNFDKSENLETGTATAINYSACVELFFSFVLFKSFF
jgi:hypothetical protein